jgi:hypothetical protein
MPLIGVPLVMASDSPCAVVKVTSVMTNGGTLSLVTIVPCQVPTAVQISSVIRIATGAGMPWLTLNQAARMPASPYIASALLAGLVGVLVIGRMNVADPSVGPGWELTAIAAAVVGGVSLFGGEGRIIGVAAGAILLEFIANGLLALHVSPYYQQVVQGIVLGIAILLDRVRASYFGRGRR